MQNILSYFRAYPKSVWLYTLLLLVPVIRKTFFNRQRDLGDFAAVDGNNIISIIVTTIIIIIILQHFNTIKNRIYPNVSTFTLYYFFALFSFLWAGFDKLPFIGYKAVEVLASFYFIGLILYKINDRVKILKYIILLSVLFTLFEMISTKFTHTNGYTYTAMIGILLSLGSVKYNILRFKDVWLFITICVVGIIFGTSSASNVSLIVGLLFLYGSGKRGVNILKLLIAVVALYLVYVIFEKEIFSLIFPGKNQDELQTMTGRTKMWEMFWNGWLKSPILGYGFSIGEKNSSIFGWNEDLGGVGSAHNMFLSVLINTGLVGMIIWIKFLYTLFVKTLKRAFYGNKYASLLFPVFVGILINANSFPAIGSDWSYIGDICYALIIFALCFIYPNKKQIPNRMKVPNNLNRRHTI